MTDFDYPAWCREQAEAIESDLRSAPPFSDLAVYFSPATCEPGRLDLATTAPDGATDVIRFPGVGSRVAAVASQHIYGGIYEACRSLPVIPIAGDMRVRVAVDRQPETVATLAELAGVWSAIYDRATVREFIAALCNGETVRDGGGAAPVFEYHKEGV